ncbi:MAG: TetR/AcrR family transcriptional regulator [Mycobacterium sp.]
MREKTLAAAELFAERGLDGTKMEDIAAATGVPKATLYYYFDGKEAILAFLFAELLDELKRAVEGALATEGTAADRLRAVVTANLRVAALRPAASLALQFDLGRAARLTHIMEGIQGVFVDPVTDLLAAGALDGSLKSQSHPRIAVVAILGAVNAVAVDAIATGSSRPAEELADDILAVVMLGAGA